MYALPITNSGGFFGHMPDLEAKKVSHCAQRLTHSTTRPTLFNRAMQICTCWQRGALSFIQILHRAQKA